MLENIAEYFGEFYLQIHSLQHPAMHSGLARGHRKIMKKTTIEVHGFGFSNLNLNKSAKTGRFRGMNHKRPNWNKH